MTLTEEEQAKIRKSWKLKLRIEEAADYTGHDKMTIHKYWNEWGLRSHYRPETDAPIGRPRITADESPSGYICASEAARVLGLSRTRIYHITDPKQNNGRRVLDGYRDENGYDWILIESIHEYMDGLFEKYGPARAVES